MKYIELVSMSDCSGCQACYQACLSSAIYMEEDKTTFLFPKIDNSKCINCGLCEKVCPAIKETLFERFDSPHSYASWINDDLIRLDSSSGGVFSAIAMHIINQRGVVFGAAFDSNFNLKHIECNKIDKLNLLRGSKYLQSDTNITFQRAKEYLKKNIPVLYCGTPCQIAGLNTFLKKDYLNLITCDFICHGVPSQKIFSHYIQGLEENKDSKMISFAFRRKKSGWKDFNFEISYISGIKDEIPFPFDPFMKGFLADLYLRPTCYKCKYSRIPRVADITLGDFWGIWNKDISLHNDKGVSAVTLNSQKGEDVYRYLFVESKKIPLEWIIEGNPAMISSVNIPRKRKLFYRLHQQGRPFNAIINKCLPPPTYYDKVLWSINKRLNKWVKRKK